MDYEDLVKNVEKNLSSSPNGVPTFFDRSKLGDNPKKLLMDWQRNLEIGNILLKLDHKVGAPLLGYLIKACCCG